jgi:methylenetetrahydrofolate dehydrogenase (NADP+) / methenyltetrahydrofolate cyclohydrolase
MSPGDTTADILSGKEAAAVWRAEVAGRVGALAAGGRRVGMATLLVGDDPASAVYVRMKHKAAGAAGIRARDVRMGGEASQQQVEEAVDALNADPDVDAYLVQLPLPDGLDPASILGRIDPSKDADGLHPVSLGLLVSDLPGPRPATPLGIMRLLDHHGVAVPGANVTIIGRSALVGRPLSIMMSAPGRDATVTVAHSRTADLAAVARGADILVVAAGRPGLVGEAHVRPGAVVVDVGTTRVGDRLTGDVRFDEVVRVARSVSPVPGGVGPMTIAALLANTVMLAEARGG